MKTIFHDKESGAKLEMEGTFSNSKAQLIDVEGNVLIESEGSYLEILEVFNSLSDKDIQDKEDTPNLKVGDYVKVKEGKECGGAKGFAIVTGIEDGDVRLKGIDVNSDYRETWINNIKNVIKIG